MAISILAAQSLPPVPQAMPGSAAALAAGQQPGDPQQQVQTDIQESQAKIEAATKGKAMETHAKIERDTHQFAADYKQRELEHAQRLRQQEEEHQQRMRQIDQEHATKILGRHAEHTVEQRHGRVVHLSALARDREEHELSLSQSRQKARTDLATRRLARKGMNGHSRKKAA
jgi:hypothetical protein